MYACKYMHQKGNIFVVFSYLLVCVCIQIHIPVTYECPTGSEEMRDP